ncbi:response regulator [Halorubrum trueperi]|uniref:histidine kinase n=1 Tax=Halorubrum trueperi TaxID=2004704 RepID=A0ABD5UF80_9EURY
MSPSPDERSIHILHIDDDPELGDLVSTYLERIDDRYAVVAKSVAREGFEHLENASVDCIICDYQMPGMNGITFLRAVREEYPNLPFFLFTGRGSEDIASKAIDAGVTSYIQKGGTEVYKQLANRIQHAVDRRRSARQAQITQERLLELYEQVNGFYLVDDEWTVQYWNHVMAERTGKSAEAVLGESLWELFPEGVDTEAYDRYHEAMETREAIQFETYVPSPHDRWLAVRAYPTDEGLSVHSRDITESKEQENQLQYRNELLESFASTVSHDLRNPLNVAEGNLQLAQDTGDFEYLEEVAQAHNRMRNLIDELLHAARGDDLELSDISLREIATQSWETVTADETTLRVEDDVVFEGYESQLQRLFENLFWNAIEHGTATQIRVGILDDGFYVEDDGTGIPPENRETIFESGFSTDSSSPGYGLSIVDGIVGVHNWTITAEASDEGGARFEIRGVELES